MNAYLTSMSTFKEIKKRVVKTLETKLPEHLSYHSTAHTLYVLDKAIFIAGKEGVKGRNLLLIKIAALYHDIGFIYGPEEHEARSCEYARKDLKNGMLKKTEIDKVCGMIMATKIPQEPKTHLERILADADLEYLGTTRFKLIGDLLFKELRHSNQKFSLKDWNKIQVKFMTMHTYHTSYCQRYREKYKSKHLANLISLVK